jgi:tetratricopeptide (TPR) repeat protein
MESMVKAASLSEEYGDETFLSDSYLNIGMLCHKFGEYDVAVEWFKKAILHANSTTDTAAIFVNLGNSHFKKGEIEQAETAFKKSLAITRQSANKFKEAVALHSLARVYENNDYATAIRYYEESLSISRKLNIPAKQCITLISLGDVLTKTGEFEKAAQYLNEALNIAENLKTPKLLFEAHFALAAFFKTQNKWKKAFYHLELYQGFEKQIFNEQSENHMKSLLSQFEIEQAKKQAEIFRLQSETLEKDADFRKRELSTMSLNLLKNNQTLTAIEKQAFQALKIADEACRVPLEQIVRYVRDNKNNDSQWQQLNESFRQVHGDFIEHLANTYPALTPMELKVSALLKIRFSTKEIANFLCISEKAVEFHRLNIRKKLSLPHTTNLATYFTAQ